MARPSHARADFDAARLANRAASKLRAYDPGHDLPELRERFGASLAELGSNENPLGPSPGALKAMRAALTDASRYPDPRGMLLKRALADHLGVDAGRIALGNGSHELLMLLAQCFADANHSVAFSQFGFAVFPIATAAAGATARCVPALPRSNRAAPLGHDLDAIASAVRRDTCIVYLANPNNPTGTWFTDAALERLLERVSRDVLVVVDEAYHEYVEAPGLSTALGFAQRFPNLVVTRTFSKAYALAGMRIGYLVAHPTVVEVLERLRESFNVNNVALAGAAAALRDKPWLAKSRAFNRAEREWLRGELLERGFNCLPSQTNFLLCVLAYKADRLERHLFEQGVIVRPMGGYGLPRALRISVGSRAGNRRLLRALESFGAADRR
ncbi:MAG TPA: histidinol-phosphate transaminase [Rhodanobacteraceae bacterium]|nr:histidinol-phosphate transaminase [Rhodanobacteraceae bacterium]